MLRGLMVRDDRKAWMRWVDPKLHKLYDRLRDELMTVEYYKAMARRLALKEAAS